MDPKRKRKRRSNQREATMGVADSSTWDAWCRKWLEDKTRHAQKLPATGTVGQMAPWTLQGLSTDIPGMEIISFSQSASSGSNASVPSKPRPAVIPLPGDIEQTSASNDGHGDDNYSDLVEWDPDYVRSEHRHLFPLASDYTKKLVSESKNLDFAKLSRGQLHLKAIIRGKDVLSLEEHPKSNFKADELGFPQHLKPDFCKAMEQELVRSHFF